MSGKRQILIGLLVAFVSGLIVIGALTLSMAERRQNVIPAVTLTHEVTLTKTQVSVETQAITATPTAPLVKITSTTEPTSTPTESVPEVQIQPTQSIANGINRYHSFLPAVYNNASEITLTEITQEPSVQVTPEATMTTEPIPTVTQQVSKKKPKSYCIPPRGWAVYIVRPGDTLARLSQATGVSIARLRKVNCMGASKKLQVGKPFFIPITPISPSLPPPVFFHYFVPQRESKSPQPTQPIVIITMPPEAPNAAIPSTDEPLSMSIASANSQEFFTTLLQRLFYAVT